MSPPSRPSAASPPWRSPTPGSSATPSSAPASPSSSTRSRPGRARAWTPRPSRPRPWRSSGRWCRSPRPVSRCAGTPATGTSCTARRPSVATLAARQAATEDDALETLRTERVSVLDVSEGRPIGEADAGPRLRSLLVIGIFIDDDLAGVLALGVTGARRLRRRRPRDPRARRRAARALLQERASLRDHQDHARGQPQGADLGAERP